jgi:ribonuclease E
LRIRDIGGLIVIDFIDMESTKNQREVEDRLRDAVRMDRARIQIGKLSRFGLLEMSRQRLRPSLGESSHIVCPRCVGIGSIRSVESMTLAVLRLIGEELRKDRTARVITQVPVEVATYLFNEKREWLRQLEDRSSAELVIVPNPNMQTPEYTIRRIRDDEVELPENRQTSYLMPTAPVPVEPGSALDKRPPAEVPAVAALLPSTPAPMVSQQPPLAPAAPPAVAAVPDHRGNGGLRGWFKKLFVGETEGTAPAPAAAPEAPPAAAPAGGGSHHRSSVGGDRQRDGRREHSRPPRRSEGGQRRGHGDGRRAEGQGRGGDGRDRNRRDHDRDRDRDHERRPPRDRDMNARPGESALGATAPAAGAAEPRANIEAAGEQQQRQFSGDRPERGERSGERTGERRGRRRGRRGGRGGGGGGREGAPRDSFGSVGAPAAPEVVAGEFAASPSTNGTHEHHEHHHEPAPPREPRESYAQPSEPRESREPREPRDAPARHQEPAAPLGHFEPSPPTESNTSREAKPYVVWSSAPSDRAASTGGRGPEE